MMRNVTQQYSRIILGALLVPALAAMLCGPGFAQRLIPLEEQPAAGGAAPAADTKGKYIITFTSQVNAAQRAEIAQQAGALVRYNYTLLNALAVYLPNDNSLNALRNNRQVAGIFPDRALSTHMPPTTPEAPSDVTVLGTTSSSVDLSWTDNASNEEGFEVERCTDGSCTSILTGPSAGSGGTVNFTDSGLQPATTYTYRVRAFITNGPPSGRNSAWASANEPATTLDETVAPAAPTNLSASAASETQVDLSWTDNASTEDGFRIYRCSGSGCTPTALLQQIDAPDVTAFSDSTVSAGTTYGYLVRAFNSAGESGDSNTAEATTPSGTSVPADPSGLLVSAVSASSVDLSWTDNADNEDGFEIERCEGSGSCATPFAVIDSTGVDQTTYTDGSVSASTTYRYRVRAFNAEGFSGYSNIAEATTSDSSSPPPPPPASVGGNRQIVPSGVHRVGEPVYLDDGTPVSDGSGIGVAVLDTGVDFFQPDLNPAPNDPGVTAFNAISGGSCQDDGDHGTHVAGIIAAQNNNIGVVGVAPGATLYCVKVLDANGASNESIVTAGLEWVALNHAAVSPPIRVVNMSLGRPLADGESIDPPSPMREMIQTLYNLGIVVVAAAGNDATLEATDHVPAGFPEVLAVAGSVVEPGHDNCQIGAPELEGDNAAFFTSDGAFDGSTGVTASAPSEERNDTIASGFNCLVAIYGIQSTRLIHDTSTLGPDTVLISRQVEPATGGVNEAIGTSFAAPHVSGLVARIMQLGLVSHSGDSLEVEGIRTYIRDTADRSENAPANSDEPAAAPLDNTLSSSYSFDGEREGIAQAPRGTP